MKPTKKKAIGELITTVVSMLLVAAATFAWLYLVVMEGRDPPKMLAVLAILGILGAIASIYSVEDIKRLKELF